MQLPYLTALGNIPKALNALRISAVPARVDLRFINDDMRIVGMSGKQVATWLVRTGFVHGDGTPSELYLRFRDPASCSAAALQALRNGYATLYARHPAIEALDDDELAELIRKETGRGLGSNVVALIQASIRGLAAFVEAGEERQDLPPSQPAAAALPMPLLSLQTVNKARNRLQGSAIYNVYLALPATTDSTVLEAIFKSLKDNLLG